MPNHLLFGLQEILLEQFKQKSEHMEKLGEISKYDKLTPWYDEMMIAPKKSRDVHIYIEITETNK